jgi:hypothetical protein
VAGRATLLLLLGAVMAKEGRLKEGQWDGRKEGNGKEGLEGRALGWMEEGNGKEGLEGRAVGWMEEGNGKEGLEGRAVGWMEGLEGRAVGWMEGLEGRVVDSKARGGRGKELEWSGGYVPDNL